MTPNSSLHPTPQRNCLLIHRHRPAADRTAGGYTLEHILHRVHEGRTLRGRDAEALNVVVGTPPWSRPRRKKAVPWAKERTGTAVCCVDARWSRKQAKCTRDNGG